MSRTDHCILAFCIVSLMALIAGITLFVRYDEKSAIRNAGRPMCIEFNPPIRPLNLSQLRTEFALRRLWLGWGRWVDNPRLWKLLDWLIECDERILPPPRHMKVERITGGIL